MIRFIIYLLVFLASAYDLVLTAQQWSAFGNLAVPRTFFQVQRLSDTKLIVMGGQNDLGSTDVCEIIDVEQHSIKRASPMNDPRTLFGSAVLPDGRIIVAGDARSIEIYDPLTNDWAVVGNMLQAFAQVSVTLIDPYQLLIVGGWLTDQCEIFDIRTGYSRSVHDFPYVTSLAKAVTTSDGHVYCFSGRSGGPGSYRSQQVHEYNEAQNVWSVSGQSAGRIYYPTITTTSTGKVVWTGGSNAESNSVDDFVDNIAVLNNGGFTNIGHLARVRAGHGCADLRDGRVLVVGGMDNYKNAITDCEYVNVSTGISTPAPSLSHGHGYFLAMDLHYEGTTYIFAISGTDGSDYIPQVEVLEVGCSGSTQRIDLLNKPHRYRGTAYRNGNKVVVTDTATFSAGAAWLASKVKVIPEFDTRFSFNLSGGSDHGYTDDGPAGGDGVVFVVQNTDPTPLGKPGQGLGYEGIPHGLAIEFDSYKNIECEDPSTNHVAVQVGDGYVMSSRHTTPFLKAIASQNVPQFIANGSPYYARVNYSGGVLSVYVNTSENLGYPVITVPIDLSRLLNLGSNGIAYFGFTSSTGFASQRHQITSWDLAGCEEIVLNVDDENTNNNSQAPFTIQPNPSIDNAQLILHEGLTSGTVQIVDVNGAMVWEATIANNADVNLPVDQLASGLYAVRVVTDDKTWSQMWSVVH